mgnify:CR=1 FL=1
MSSLSLKNISVVYNENSSFSKKALDNINVDFPEGKIIGIIGKTGSGKSTLASLLNGLIQPTSGQVLLDNKDIWEDPKKIRDVRFKVGLSFQYPEYQLFGETVREDISFGPKNMGLSEKEIAERVNAAALFCGIDPKVMNNSPFELSGGQRRRVAIAGIVAMDPSILVLDEPASGLDPVGREEILGGIVRNSKERGTTTIIISHSMEDIAKYVDRIVVMNKGSKMLDDEPKKVFAHYEELEKVGLAAPQVTYMMHALAEKGIPVNTQATTISEAVETITQTLKK